MPLDPAISLQLQPLKIESPLETMQRVLTMRDLLSREKLTQQEIATGQENARRIGLENQALTRKNAGDKAVQATVQKYTKLDIQRDPTTGEMNGSGNFSIDHDAVVADLMRQGFTEHALAYSKNQKEIEDNAYNAQVHQLDLHFKKLEQIGQVAQSVLNAPPDQKPMLHMAGIAQLKAAGIVNDQQLQAQGLAGPYTPQMEQPLRAAAQQALSVKEQIDNALKLTQDARAQKAADDESKLKAADTRLKNIEADVKQSEIDQMPKDINEYNERLLKNFGGNEQDPTYQLYKGKAAILRKPVPRALDALLKESEKETEATRQAVATAKAEEPAKVAAAVAIEQAKAGNDPRLTNVPPSLHKDVLDKVQKAEDEHVAAQAATDTLNTFINSAKAGNKEAYAYAPVAGVLEINTGAGIKRINRQEIEAYAGAGSLFDRLQGALGKQVSGASLSPSVLNDMQALHNALGANTDTTYQRKIQSINKTYGSKFESSPTGKTAGASPIIQQNKKTGAFRYSTDGGKTWLAGKPQ